MTEIKIPPGKSAFKIKFDGETHEIDANVFINSLIHITSLVQEVNRELDSDKNIDIKVKAIEEGSFLVHLELVESIKDQIIKLFTPESIKTASYVVGTMVGLFTLKKMLKGKEPEIVKKRSGNKVEIENSKGDTIVVENFTYNIYNSNTIVNEAISKQFESLRSDSSIFGFELTDENEKPIVQINRDEFVDMSLKNESILNSEKKNSRTVPERTTLNITRLAFDEKYKWDFYYRGNKISAKVTDEAFNNRVDNGERFAKGDTLEVELNIRQVYDSSIDTYINKSYEIIEVIKHHPRGTQQELDL